MIIRTHGEFPMEVGDILLVKTGRVLHRIHVLQEIHKSDKKAEHYARVVVSKEPARVHGSSNSVGFTGGER